MQSKIALIVIALVIIVGAGFFVLNRDRAPDGMPPPPGDPNETFCPQDVKLCYDGSAVARKGPMCEFDRCPDGLELYSNPAYNLSFGFPDTYATSEREAGNAERGHYAITLIDKDDAQVPENGEGPMAINVDIFQNNIDKQTAEAWIKNSANSNFKQSPDGKLTRTIVAEKQGLSYVWDGLYQGESVVIADGDHIYMFSVTFDSREDQIRLDFEDLLERVKLGDAGATVPAGSGEEGGPAV